MRNIMRTKIRIFFLKKKKKERKKEEEDTNAWKYFKDWDMSTLMELKQIYN